MSIFTKFRKKRPGKETGPINIETKTNKGFTEVTGSPTAQRMVDYGEAPPPELLQKIAKQNTATTNTGISQNIPVDAHFAQQ